MAAARRQTVQRARHGSWRGAPAMCVCCSRQLNWWMVVNMLISLPRRLANRSNLRNTPASSISNGWRGGARGGAGGLLRP